MMKTFLLAHQRCEKFLCDSWIWKFSLIWKVRRDACWFEKLSFLEHMMKTFLLASSAVWKFSLIWKVRFGVLVKVDLKSCLSSTWTQDALRWLEDKHDICIFWRTGKLLFIRWLAKDTRCIIIFKKVSQAPSFSGEVWVEKEVDAHVSTRSKLMQKRKIDTHVDVQGDIETYTRSKSMQRYKIDVHFVVQAGVYIYTHAQSWCRLVR